MSRQDTMITCKEGLFWLFLVLYTAFLSALSNKNATATYVIPAIIIDKSGSISNSSKNQLRAILGPLVQKVPTVEPRSNSKPTVTLSSFLPKTPRTVNVPASLKKYAKYDPYPIVFPMAAPVLGGKGGDGKPGSPTNSSTTLAPGKDHIAKSSASTKTVRQENDITKASSKETPLDSNDYEADWISGNMGSSYIWEKANILFFNIFGGLFSKGSQGKEMKPKQEKNHNHNSIQPSTTSSPKPEQAKMATSKPRTKSAPPGKTTVETLDKLVPTPTPTPTPTPKLNSATSNGNTPRRPTRSLYPTPPPIPRHLFNGPALTQQTTGYPGVSDKDTLPPELGNAGQKPQTELETATPINSKNAPTGYILPPTPRSPPERTSSTP